MGNEEMGTDPTGWWADLTHDLDHGQVLAGLRAEVAKEVAHAGEGALTERVRAVHATWGGPVRVLFHAPPQAERQGGTHYGVWRFAGRAPDHSAEVADVLYRTGTGCAVHQFPARLAADGTLFLPGDPACPEDAPAVLVFDAACQWAQWRDTALVTITGAAGARTVGPLQEVDLDASWLASVMPTRPRPRRHRRSR